MDGIRGEVSNKIRSAIKAKLMELGAYVDDELPDYIMVMVANKRSRQQMEDDLQLFLGDSTSTFTAWLHTVLNKLQQVTVNNTELKKGSEKKRPSIDDEKKDKRKKLKKEKDKEKPEKLGKAQEKSKIKNSAGEDKTEDTNRSQIQGKQIKSEPVDRAVPEASLQSKLSTHVNHQSASSITSTIQERNSSEARANEEEDDDDFINIKADVEADMWGETDETAAAAKNLNKSVAAPPPSRESKQQEPKEQELNRDQMNPAASEKLTSDSILPDAASVSACVSPSKNIESRPAPRIIKISETIRQEQETMKPSSKAVRDPQGDRRPPSPIFFTNTSETIEDDSEIFGRRIACELRKMSPELRKLVKLKIEQDIIDYQGTPHKGHEITVQPLKGNDSKKKAAPKSKRLRDRSKEKRRKRKKRSEVAIGRLNHSSHTNLDRISHRLEMSLEENGNNARLLPVRFGPLRMDSPSLSRTRVTNSSSRVDKFRSFVRDESPTPPRTVSSVVTSCNP